MTCLPREGFGDNLLILLEESTPLVGKNNVDATTAFEDVGCEVDGDVMLGDVLVTVVTGGNFMDDAFCADVTVVIVTDATCGNVIVTAVTFADVKVTDVIVSDVTADDDIVGDDVTYKDVRICGVKDSDATVDNEVG